MMEETMKLAVPIGSFDLMDEEQFRNYLTGQQRKLYIFKLNK